MNIGIVGLGKLGLPCALAMEHYGQHNVFGIDTSMRVLDYIRSKAIPYWEKGAQDLLDQSAIEIRSMEDLVAGADIVFVAVQTPHDPRFEGITPLTDERSDFDYSYLIEAVGSVADAAGRLQKDTLLVVISTVLPGTIDHEIKPILNRHVTLCYNPFFIAMGTTIQDFMKPEFVLLGADDPSVFVTLEQFYRTLHQAPLVKTSICSAELIKVAYNTFIGMKIVFANTLMEICEATGANVDHVTDALAMATERLISPKYMKAGMGDGGGCHPRDNIAMSWLARKLGLSFDLFDAIMTARERQTAWLADLAIGRAKESGLPIVILGKAFKPETNLTVGSPSLLLQDLLRGRGVHASLFDPLIDNESDRPSDPAVYVIGTKHEAFASWTFPPRSVVIDPWRYIPASLDIEVMGLGNRTPQSHI